MLKKLSAVYVVLMLVITMASGFTALAEDSLSYAASAEDCARVVQMVDDANDKIESEVLKAQSGKGNPDLDKLIEKTNKIAEKVIDKAEKYGIEVVCEYVEYEINGQIVLIDPLKIISR